MGQITLRRVAPRESRATIGSAPTRSLPTTCSLLAMRLKINGATTVLGSAAIRMSGSNQLSLEQATTRPRRPHPSAHRAASVTRLYYLSTSRFGCVITADMAAQLGEILDGLAYKTRRPVTSHNHSRVRLGSGSSITRVMGQCAPTQTLHSFAMNLGDLLLY